MLLPFWRNIVLDNVGGAGAEKDIAEIEKGIGIQFPARTGRTIPIQSIAGFFAGVPSTKLMRPSSTD
jgi:hypothetical protein